MEEVLTVKANINENDLKALNSSFDNDYLGTWANLAKENIFFKETFNEILDESDKPHYKWFLGGKTNISYNCLDVHLKDKANKTALIFEDELGEAQTLTYKELHEKVVKFSAYLRDLGIRKGDRICIYMSLCPESIIAIQACLRIGAIHSVVFAGFSAHALRDRINELEAKLLITQNAFIRRNKKVELFKFAREALTENQSVTDLILFDRVTGDTELDEDTNALKKSLDIKIHKPIQDLLADKYADIQNLTTLEPEWLESNETSFILYTSGSTGKPKGIEHGTSGYILWAKLSTNWVFDLKDEDVYWCTADIGWITGHTYVTYGPLANGATQVIYEGAPNFPDKNQFWNLIEKYKVSIFYTAPTAIRAFEQWGLEHIEKHDLSSLRLLGSVGEPIGSETWKWFYENIGKSKCPIVDTWWQTETGGIMISTLPGVQTAKPGIAGPALPGIHAEISEDSLLHISKPWPSMLKGIYKNPERYKKAYWSLIEDSYLPGDLATIDEDSYICIGGRNDDVINISGHRLGTAEIETALAKHVSVLESAVVAIPHKIKGQGLVCFVVSNNNSGDLSNLLTAHIASEIGAHAKPERVIACAALPKTRSGKVMRRLLQDLAQGKDISGDISTLEDKSVLEAIKSRI
ncbi:MAG: acetate--CoA ligase [Candidatus Caenarcaniphilales bacterium]|nr:acetate--CoA ligase [Candidatus Caenarcaniphilales bacterium]